ncbi:MAG: addiction module antidote protein, HigA family [Sphingobacteriales bacterium]|nr:MAG: addiction module antidote protein, HigA family [Sphingobacteriales bacterium]
MATINEYIPQSRPHPGITLSEKLEEMGMGIKEFALRTGKPEKTIIAVLGGESSITPDMAVQFEDVTRIPVHFWLNHQRAYDEFVARTKKIAIIEQAVKWARNFPLREMISKGWLPEFDTIQERTAALLRFFGFANHEAWEEYYCNQQLKVAFRISLASTNEPYAISAWLRKGELLASQLLADDYSEKKFKEILPGIKSIMSSHPENFFQHLQDICLTAGVKVVYTPTLPKAPICGCTRWINDTPLIQLSGRYKRNDSFWFTFFHEAGHILLHGKKDIFLEKVEYTEKDKQKEDEADKFACKWTLSDSEEQEIISSAPLDDDKIRGFAKKFNTHPAIIIGRLQFKKRIHFSLGRQYIEQVVLE